LKELESLLFLEHFDASKNKIRSVQIFEQFRFKFMRTLDLSSNLIKGINEIKLPTLRTLNLQNNLLTSVGSLMPLTKLIKLEIRGNKLQNLDFLGSLASLEELYAADNQIIDVQGLAECPKLRVVHLRKNKIAEFKVSALLNQLSCLNLRENLIENMDSLVAFLQSHSQRKIDSLNFLANPVLENKELEHNKLILGVAKVTKINKEEIAPDDK